MAFDDLGGYAKLLAAMQGQNTIPGILPNSTQNFDPMRQVPTFATSAPDVQQMPVNQPQVQANATGIPGAPVPQADQGGIGDKLKGLLGSGKGQALGMALMHIGAAVAAPPEQRGAILAQLPGNIATLQRNQSLDNYRQAVLLSKLGGKNMSTDQLLAQEVQKAQQTGDWSKVDRLNQAIQGKKAAPFEKAPQIIEIYDDQGKKQKGYMDASGNFTPVGSSIADKPTKEPRIGLTTDAEGNQVYAEITPGMPGPKAPAAPIDPQAVDYVAKIFNQTGEMPAMGMGAADFRKAVLSRAAQMQGIEGGDANNVVQNKAFYGSLKTGLNQLEKQKSTLEPFMETFDRNIDVALDVGKKVDRTGVPVINAWWNAGRRSISGNPDISAFDTATKTVVNEFTRITTTANAGNTQMAEQEIKKMENLLNTAQTPEQYMAVLEVMKRDTANRKASLENGINLKRKQIGELSIPGGGSKSLRGQQVGPAATQQIGPGVQTGGGTDLRNMSTQQLLQMRDRLKGGQ